MNHYFITGTSRGIGKSVAECALSENDSVTGISRTGSIINDNYIHEQIDLGNMDQVKNYHFREINESNHIVLINNAATLGGIKHAVNLKPEEIERAYNINLISPVILTNKFLNTFSNNNCRKTIVNLSSGAAHSPYDGWSLYCSSKAGLQMFSEAVDLENKINKNQFQILSIAPGVVETNMQNEIREADLSDFSKKEKFIELKENHLLYDVRKVAEKMISIIQKEQHEDITYRISF